MKLQSISYEEFKGDPKEWVLAEVEFGQINLIVGENSSGKTRLLNVLNGLAKLISGKRKDLYMSGTYDVSFDFDGQNYLYQLTISNKNITSEKLSIDGKQVLSRDETGEGKIFAQEMNKDIRFQTPTTELAAVYRRDSIQHPFLEKLYLWGNSAKHYLFGSDFGKGTLGLPNSTRKDLPNLDQNYLAGVFHQAFSEYGDSFKQSVLKDFREIGYSCSDIEVSAMDDFSAGNSPLLGLSVQEETLNSLTPQTRMSQGMFRALALAIQLNVCVYSESPATFFVDDIGEGLDFKRSVSTILLLIEKASKNDFQLFMTTNDRFIMNEIDLKFWSILKRTGSSVTVFNHKTSKDEFESFQYVGLSNFDFFSNEYYLSNKK